MGVTLGQGTLNMVGDTRTPEQRAKDQKLQEERAEKARKAEEARREQEERYERALSSRIEQMEAIEAERRARIASGGATQSKMSKDTSEKQASGKATSKDSKKKPNKEEWVNWTLSSGPPSTSEALARKKLQSGFDSGVKDGSLKGPLSNVKVTVHDLGGNRVSYTCSALVKRRKYTPLNPGSREQ